MSHLLLHEKKLYERMETDLFSGWTPAKIEVKEGRPNFTWKGAKIPWALWAEVVSFLRWTQEKFKEEALVTFFYHPDDRKWGAWAFPQEPNGMTVRLLPEHPLYKEDRQRFGRGWIQFGSIHHHCTAKAFQSGTDSKDECDRDGVHFTIGELDKDMVDIHCRQVTDGIMSECHPFSWVEAPPYLTHCPRSLIVSFTLQAMRAVKEEDYPDEWENRIFEKTKQISLPFTQGGHTTAPAVEPPESRWGGGGQNNGHREPYQRNGSRHHSFPGPTVTTPWEEKCKEAITVICKGLSLAPLEMLSLLNTPKSSQLTLEESVLKAEVVKALNKFSIPPVYAERLLDEMTH